MTRWNSNVYGNNYVECLVLLNYEQSCTTMCHFFFLREKNLSKEDSSTDRNIIEEGIIFTGLNLSIIEITWNDFLVKSSNFVFRGVANFPQIKRVMLCTHTGNDRFYQQQCGIRQHAYSFRRLYCHFLVLSHETNNRVHEWRWKLDYLVVMGYRRMPLPPSDFLINLDEEWREREQTFETIGRFIVVTVFFNGIEYLYKTARSRVIADTSRIFLKRRARISFVSQFSLSFLISPIVSFDRCSIGFYRIFIGLVK